jgi:dinuclear metal center YbgI/SA1388 family protein
VRVAELVRLLEERYPPSWAEDWDRVGLVLGDPDASVSRVLLAVDCVEETAAEALEVGAQLLVTHHPLLLRGVSSVAPTTYKGRIVHSLIRGGVALFTAHTNADVAFPGVSDALASRLGLLDVRPLVPVGDADGSAGRGHGRIGRLAQPVDLETFARTAASALPQTFSGVRVGGDLSKTVSTVAVAGGSGDAFLGAVVKAGVDAYLTADLRHHPASEHLANAGAAGPALVDAAHWATERPWLDDVAAHLRAGAGVETIVSDLVTDAWTMHLDARLTHTPVATPEKEPYL